MNKAQLKVLITKIAVSLLSLSMLVLSYIYLRHLPKYILIISLALIASVGVATACVDEEKHGAFYKLLLFLNAAIMIVLASFIILDQTGILEKITSFEVLKQFILSSKWGIATFFFLTVFQVVVLPIPSALTILIGVAIYGPLTSFIVSTLGTIIGSLIAFALGKVFGRKLVVWMIGKEKTDKYADVLDHKGRFAFILMMLFPCFPDDILCMVAGMTSMSYRYFMIAICLTRPVMIAFFSFFGSGSIIPFSGWGIPVWIALFCLALIAFLLLNKLKDLIFKKQVRKHAEKQARKKAL